MSQAKARAMLNQAVSEARHKMMDEYEDFINENEKARERSFWGGLGGSILLPLLGAAIPGGLGLVAGSLLAGAGSRMGSEIGEKWGGSEGVQEDFDAGVGYGSATLGREMEQNVSDMYGGFDTKQWGDAGKAALTTAIAGGGGKIFKDALNPAYNIPMSVRAEHMLMTQGNWNPMNFLWAKYLESGSEGVDYLNKIDARTDDLEGIEDDE